MRSFLATFATVAILAGTYSSAPAADDRKLTPQREKMKACNAEAGDKKGDERKAFMSNCLSAGAPAAPMTQQDGVKNSHADASSKVLKGDERRGFRRECENAGTNM